MIATILFILVCEINFSLAVAFSMGATFHEKRDWLIFVACCIIPVIPFGYFYRWCDRFVRGM